MDFGAESRFLDISGQSASRFTLPLSRVPKQSKVNVGHWNEEKLMDGASDVQLQEIDEFSYLAPISIGGQFFEVIFDTGSSDLWIASSSCTDDDCERIKKYVTTSTLSLTSVPFNLTYLTGAVSGATGYETIVIGPYMVFSQVLALVNSTTNMTLSTTGSSGVLGLSFPLEASIPANLGRTLLDSVFSSLDPSDRFFSFKLSADPVSNSFSIGQVDPAYSDLVSKINYSPVYTSAGADYDYWKLPLLSLSVNSVPIPFALSPSKVVDSSSPIAVLDTGTTMILGPTHDVDNFWTVAGGAQKSADGTWQVRCNHVVMVGVVLGNDTARKEIILDPSDISWMPSVPPSDGWCLGGVQSNDGVFSGDWLFGDVFLRNTYVVHYAATPSSPPLIGLLGTTNASHALKLFQTARGNDTLPSVEHTGLFFHNRTAPKSGLIISTTLIFAFLGGAAFMILLRVYREKNGRIHRIKAIQKQW